jgi:hypothetical protein
MGYYLQAIIGKQQTLAQHASDFQHARLVPLAQGIDKGAYIEGFWFGPSQVVWRGL